MNVLVIDGEMRAIEMLRRALRLVGHKVIGATTQGELVELVNTLAPTRIGAVLLDESIAGFDADEVIDTLKGWCPGLPVLLVSRCGPPSSDNRLLTRVEGVIEKPFDLEELDQALSRFSQVRSSTPPPSWNAAPMTRSEPPRPAPLTESAPVPEQPSSQGVKMNEPAQRLRRKRVLLVDDTETVLMFEKLMLGSNGYEVVVARDGNQALQTIAKSPPDLVLLDIMMPQLDGIQTCRAIKSNPDTQAIPVIMVTTRGEPEKVEEAFLAGCDDYLTKPLDRLELLVKIRSFLK